MTPNSFPDKALREVQVRELLPESRQGIDTADVADGSLQENIQKSSADLHEAPANSNLDKRMQPGALKNANPISSNALGYSELRRIECPKSGGELDEKPDRLIAPSTLARWCKFNLVGGLGVAVQFAALFVLRSGMHFNYLFATAIAVEAAVVHNFVWHEQFTWADRINAAPQRASGAEQFAEKRAVKTSRAKALTEKKNFIAELKRCATQTRVGSGERCEPGKPKRPNWLSGASRQYGPSLRRLLRFNLGNGAVSILGNLALMKVMVGLGHMNYLLANGIAIALCSVANFLVSEEWVFGRT